MNTRFQSAIAKLAATLVLGILLTRCTATSMGAERPPAVNVILWFDTEDYILPADDDATKRLCDMLTERGIRATFKLVGEKARVLERRGRQDVIDALKRHDIGYHTDYHSVHPTPAEYLADCGWVDGIEEFVRREAGGAADVRRILGVPVLACYGQPGSSWGPQAVAALPLIGVAPHGVPCYVDDDSHIGFDGKPFWYAGALNVFRMNPNLARMELHEPAALEAASKRVASIANRLSAEGGGLISIYYHPCEWVHTQFWDGVNFARGANPPREAWRPPPQRSKEETDSAFKRFGDYVDFISSLPGVRWITASDLPGLYPDRARSSGATEADLNALASQLVKEASTGLDFRRIGDRAFSVAEQFELLAIALDASLDGRPVVFPLRPSVLFGPDTATAPHPTLTTLTMPAFRAALRDARGFVEKEHRIPARVFVGSELVPPADFLVAMAAVWTMPRSSGAPPKETSVPLGKDTRILPERHLAKETPELYGNWIIHKEGFRAPKLVDLARLQTWTLKPAILNPAP